jgi:transglutaminase/protease-like cytokinesis protein 3
MNRFWTYFVLAFIFGSLDISAQDLHLVDSIIDTYPKSFLSPERLSIRIYSDFKDQTQRARAIYAWVGKNIEYDVKALNSHKKRKSFSYNTTSEKLRKEAKLQTKVANQTFRKKKAVCYGYSVLYKKLCDLCEIPCMVISGGDKTKYSQIDRKPSRNAHAWNSVKINNSWEFIDVTWAAGSVDKKIKRFIPDYSDTYFFLSPEKFFLKHFPKDTSWILTNKTKEDFVKLPLYYSDYLSMDITIINPLEGVISIAEKDTINFKISNLPQSYSISYKFSNEKFAHFVEPDFLDISSCEFSIVNTSSRDGYLVLFIEEKPFAAYKIRLL